MQLEHVETIVQPWYRQFYARRGDAAWASDRISPEGYDAGLAVIAGFVYVGTSMYGSPTTVRIEVHDTVPPLRDDADHVAEVSLEGDGPLSVLSWGSDQPEGTVALPDGPCRLRASWFGLDPAERHPDNDLGGNDPSPESVLLEVWPAPSSEPRVRRRRRRT